MNNLKFKAWNHRQKKMYRVYGIDFEYDLVYCASTSGTTHTFGFINVYLCQFTGLIDRHGNDIYNHDIIRLDNEHYPISYFDGSFQMNNTPDQLRSPAIQDRTKRFIVAGNIYENPNLLESFDNDPE